jgi:hypothetical protein
MMKIVLCKSIFFFYLFKPLHLFLYFRLKAQRKAEQLSRHESRQAVMKRRQAEREVREAKRLKLHHLQREEARVRSQEQKLRNDARKRLDEDERAMHKKEEQVERDMRKYSNHRIKPLGRDKFYNRYYYLDDIGGTLLHGSGKLFVQSPSDTDLMVLLERDAVESIDKSTTLPCGRGGGVKFTSQLLKEQGLVKESEFFEKRVQVLKHGDTNTVDEWWLSYDEPEDVCIYDDTSITNNLPFTKLVAKVIRLAKS